MWNSSSELFKLVDDQAGGTIQTIKRRLKFKLRHSWFRRELNTLMHYIHGQQLHHLLQVDPSLYLKCTRSYLWTGLGASQRVMLQLAFFDWLLTRFSTQYIRHFYTTQHINISSLTIKDQVIDVLIQPARGLGREGELALTLNLNKHVIMKASFTVVPAELVGMNGAGYVMFVGGFQGQRDTRELVKEATQLMERTKPNAIMFNALQGIAEAWGLVAILGASNSTHAFSSYRRSLAKRVGLDYDSLWQELGAQEQTKFKHWVLPRTWQPRPESEIESKKRSAHRRRNTFRQNFIDLCIGGTSQLTDSQTVTQPT
jgi:uncharacterized protein VirK/YbjX